ncbi:hypothetical protein L596_027911 [Steinernema carpocapsae]|uniref:WH2 domain-containing protein n=1 Tax=Steinernema carpocapsae TaxID=34508 RepID=A0A4U5LWY3_STECR|nr:hypothetical protein L596_027911 [Steinernema carpocapsae]
MDPSNFSILGIRPILVGIKTADSHRRCSTRKRSTTASRICCGRPATTRIRCARRIWSSPPIRLQLRADDGWRQRTFLGKSVASSSIGGHMSSGYASSHQSGYNQPKMGMTAAPPPPPARQPAPARPTPPRPPPMSSGAPTRPPPARPLPQPVTTSYRPNDNPPPPPPPSMSMSHGAPPPPPPPPPPPMMGAGAPPPPPPPPPPSGAPSGRANLLQQIQAGTTLKPVTNGGSNGGAPVASNPRDDVMAQIRQGNAQLKHVDPTDVENRKSSNSLQDMGGIAGALARALEERRKNMRDSSDSEDDDERDDSEWEDE